MHPNFIFLLFNSDSSDLRFSFSYSDSDAMGGVHKMNEKWLSFLMEYLVPLTIEHSSPIISCELGMKCSSKPFLPIWLPKFPISTDSSLLFDSFSASFSPFGLQIFVIGFSYIRPFVIDPDVDGKLASCRPTTTPNTGELKPCVKMSWMASIWKSTLDRYFILLSYIFFPVVSSKYCISLSCSSFG